LALANGYECVTLCGFSRIQMSDEAKANFLLPPFSRQLKQTAIEMLQPLIRISYFILVK
jgi:hypothetical protein